jgi:alcohol dehydrogenase, propanol-preferring
MSSMYANELDVPAPLSERPLEWRTAPKPEPADGQILIAVAGCGVCRSNLHMIEGEWVASGVPAISPIVPGHEVTGRVAELGAGVDDFAIGEAVGVQPLWWTCERCEFCTSGREHLCHQRKITGEHVDGGYGEYMLAYAAHTYHLPEGLDIIEAAPLFCPGITAYGAVDKLAIGPGDTVAVFGLGGVGHMAIQFAALAGADVMAIGRSEDHLDVALELGASRAINSSDFSELDEVEDSADAVISFAPSDAVTEQALRVLKWGGTLVMGVPLSVSGFPFNTEKVIKTSVLGNREQMRTVLELAAQGKVRTVVDRFPMEQATDVLELLAGGKLRSRAVLENANVDVSA